MFSLCENILISLKLYVVREKASNIIELVEEMLGIEDSSNTTLREENNITDVIRLNVEKEMDDYCADFSVKEDNAYQYNLV